MPSTTKEKRKKERKCVCEREKSNRASERTFQLKHTDRCYHSNGFIVKCKNLGAGNKNW
jgi:hypothetical protein